MHQKMSFGGLSQEESQAMGGGVAQVVPAEVLPGRPNAQAQGGMQSQRSVKQGMKECPVCHARCFADMDVCYNCLHAFKEEESPLVFPQAQAANASARGLAADDRLRVGEQASVAGAVPGSSAVTVPYQVGFGTEAEHDVYSNAEASSSDAEPDSAPDANSVIQILVSISLAHDACTRNGAPTPVVKVETR